jgi:membrane-associated phospholipid phosphatase
VKILLCVFVLLPAFGQTQQSGASTAVDGQVRVPKASTPSQSPVEPSIPDTNRSVIKPEPGDEAIKPKDYYDGTGYLHPFRRMPKYILMDQKAIWSSPFHTSKKNAKWWAIFGAGTVALIATDKYVAKNAPNPHWLQTAGNDASYLGEPYTLLPIAAGLYLGGTAWGSDHFREAGLLSFESLADVTILELALKSIFDRQRPLEGHGNGEFGASTSPRYNSSFPSGHAIETFALASVFAHEYPRKRWVQLLAYSYASGVVGARLAANKHFPGDVLFGGAIGWFVGDYVYGKRHNEELDKKPSIAQTILDNVRIGGAYPTVPINKP